METREMVYFRYEPTKVGDVGFITYREADVDKVMFFYQPAQVRQLLQKMNISSRERKLMSKWHGQYASKPQAAVIVDGCAAQTLCEVINEFAQRYLGLDDREGTNVVGADVVLDLDKGSTALISHLQMTQSVPNPDALIMLQDRGELALHVIYDREAERAVIEKYQARLPAAHAARLTKRCETSILPERSPRPSIEVRSGGLRPIALVFQQRKSQEPTLVIDVQVSEPPDNSPPPSASVMN